MSKRRSFLFGALGVVGTLITTFIAFLLFLGGISGMGNETLLTLAMVVFAAPFVLTAVIGLFKAVSKTGKEQERFQNEVSEEWAPRDPLSFRVILKRAAIGALVIVLFVAGLMAYEYVSRLEPTLIQGVLDHDVEKVRRLLDEGEDPNQLSHHGATPLMSALASEQRATNEIVALLLDYGADPDQPSHRPYEPHSDVNYRRTPVVVIATQRSNLGPDALQLLIDNEADLNPIPAHQRENSPVVSAIAWDHSEMIDIMLAAGARLGASDDRDVQMVIRRAVSTHDSGLVRMLIAEDPDGPSLSRAIHWVEYHWRDKSCENYYSTLARLLMEEANRRGDEQFYPESAMTCS